MNEQVPYAWINEAMIPKTQASVGISDLAIQRGYGIFDYLKTIAHEPVFIDAYLERFFHSAAQLRIPVPADAQTLKTRIQALIEHNQIPDSGIKLTLTGGYSPDAYSIAAPNLIITQQPLTLPTAHQFEKGLRLITYPHQRQMPEAKTIDYLMAIWLQPQIKEQQADDVLYFKDGLVTECPRANFFIITPDDTLVTASQNILKGIMRGKVLEIAGTRIKAEVRPLAWEELEHAKEAFITSTTKQLLPIIQIDEQVIGDGTPGKISRWLYQELDKLVSGSDRTGNSGTGQNTPLQKIIV